MSWDSYVAMMTNTLDPETNAYTVTGVGTFGAIYGTDGSKWGNTEGFELYAYEYEIDGGDGTTTKVAINEVDIVKDILGGKTKGGDAGIRLGNKKYMHISEYDGVHKLVCSGGGALIAKTEKCYMVCVYDTKNNDSNGKPQNPGDVEKNMLYLRTYLTENGY
ncbi:unnamed protein product [Moneuplotes crassus]|uniref:Profilin n=1 Tax=Euplotes crassus TaxID=5936 RepID=A0AAD2D733_EUPCR|nr:unnamed protein product [Moneuplotes crassus]|mmetsp:Transcript_31709/g.31148  ORF Transcript_31709/g.31148 Transcript_31709/m.31148 type:complete len:162 (-) Transcript_31709:67-552(-)|eukprot:CAMPEP_0197003992 /NCGR_PEP_ID=MMETSP1380-20130617/17103_1 /TAXON_ID=5936 /ORGANISM="Euplotes crassus, Strain CT5" /LENGTH=161 /DNA_ID=CAMNT_0042422627 /DNA_START=37 /DNA_END=522 /DNA_ORIENTATION=+